MSIETEGFATDTSPRTAGRLVRSYRVLWSVLLLGWLVSYADRTLTGPVISWMIQNKAGFIGEAAHPATLGGLVGSMFFACYMLTQYPGGRLGDRFDDPDRYDIKRNVSGHVCFGMGIHQCVGQHVARLEGEIVLAALARKVDRWQITGQPKRRLNNTLRAWDSLPVTVSSAANS